MRTSRLICVFLGALCVLSNTATALPLLTLSVDGPSEASSPGSVTVEVNATNAEFALGGLSYTLQLNVALTVTARQYATFGWVANDGLFDNSSPAQAASLSSTLSSLKFDTVVAPAGSERSVGTVGPVDRVTISIPAGLPAGTILDLSLKSVSASDGAGNDLVTSLNGSLTAQGLQILVPEPACLGLLALGGLLASRRQRG